MSCMCLCKDTNFKANHNNLRLNGSNCLVVCAYAKILILKQITTDIGVLLSLHQLYVPMQRY